MKRAFDIAVAVAALAVASPFLAVLCVLIWAQDRHSPLYIATRVGRHGIPFRMVKLRSMVVGADRTGVDSTSATDPRITAVGRFVRRYKLDELGQLVNVVGGQMSLVGPRPNVPREVALYSEEECRLLSVRPGMTDLASIVFSDEQEVLAAHPDATLAYHQLIRPWKNRLGLAYVDHHTPLLDLRVLLATAMGFVSRPRALATVDRILGALGADDELRKVARRCTELRPAPPPGLTAVVELR